MLEVVKWKVNPPLYLQSRYRRPNSAQIYPVPAGLTVHHLFALVDPQVKNSQEDNKQGKQYRQQLLRMN